MFFFLLSRAVAKTKYAIMMDAGSSGTRAYVYTWETTSGIPDVRPAENKSNQWIIKAPVRLSDAASDPGKIAQIFLPIIEYTSKRIPEEYIPRTHVYVYATAGMRLLTAPDRERVIEMSYNYLSQHSKFVIKRKNIRVIDGIEEGVYGWLSVNHLQGNLKNNLPTKGAIDLGGASFQIALQVGDDDLVNDALTVTIGPKKIRVFAHSYLGYGVDVSSRTITKSIAAVKMSSDIDNPCFPVGYTTKVGEIKVNGTGNFDQCAALTEKILVEGPNFETVNIPGLAQTKEFVGMANLYFVNDFYGLKEDSTFAELKEKGMELCSTPWRQLEEKYKDKPKALPYIPTYCYCAAYQYSFLTKGFKFNDDKVKLVKVDTIDEVDLSWTIGAMLAHVADIEIAAESSLPFRAVFLANIFAFCILVPIYVFIGRKFKPVRSYSNTRL
jgi:apyrase